MKNEKIEEILKECDQTFISLHRWIEQRGAIGTKQAMKDFIKKHITQAYQQGIQFGEDKWIGVTDDAKEAYEKGKKDGAKESISNTIEKHSKDNMESAAKLSTADQIRKQLLDEIMEKIEKIERDYRDPSRLKTVNEIIDIIKHKY